MAERLTEFVTKNCSKPFYRFNENSHISIRYRYCNNIDKAINKLGRLEDIMEEYGMVDIQDFKDCLESMYDESINAKKLKEFQDIMKKYDIESFELLEHIIKKGKVINSVIEDFAKEEYDKMKQDRDTWKRACELACENMKLPVDILIGNKEFNECHSIVEYFYQQAKKEGENK